uniref:(E2-independent) E3 ubiquitin-conjugating enzyme FATS n=1 Tax=Doryrhamphus excisus TaxID=161450 RepID=UPI0025AE4AC0|nr:(E2-independent) E3 ubiquitin-conjugating enzyme FATS [Doryrhamphus excisus]
MTLRRPAAHLPTGWRRSGDESMSSKGGSLSYLSRPRSALEGRQLDNWLQHLHRMQSDHNPTPASSNRTTPTLDREPSGQTCRPYRSPSFSGVSSPCGSQWGSLVGSQDSLQSEFFVPVGRRGSLERVHIMQTPKKEQSQVSCLAPVKTGWLPIQKRVMMVEDARNQGQMSTHRSASQVKLKQAITPTFQKSRGSVSMHQEVERSPGRTWRTHDQGSPVIKQGSAAHEKHGIWRALRRGWNSNRTSEPPTPRVEEPREQSPQTSSTCKVFIPLRRASSGHPVTPPDQQLRRNSLQPSHIQTSSAATTLVPHHKVGFSSITISSRKVTRSASLTSSDRPAYDHLEKTRQPLPDVPMDQTSSGVQRKPTIVKVVQQRTTLSTHPSSLDTLVHRRKAAIIKVTEHKESYSPARETSQRPDGTHKENGTWSQGSHPDDKNGDISHTSTLRLPVNNAPSEISGQKPKRPLSCHGNVFPRGDEPSEERVLPPPAVRKWSLSLPQETTPCDPASWSPLGPVKGAADAWKLRKDQWRRSSPCLTLIQTPEPHQSPEEVLALNAAAIIANIKLQRQLSKKKTSHGNLEGESAAPPQGNTDTHTNPDDRGRDVSQDTLPVPLSPDHQRPREIISLQEALRRSRPHFISRSQERVRKLEHMVQERRQRSSTAGPQTNAALRQRGGQKAWSTSGHLSKFKEGASVAAGKTKERRTNCLLTEVKKKKEEEMKKKKEACLTNRQRVELFRKKLLDQILHRNSS